MAPEVLYAGAMSDSADTIQPMIYKPGELHQPHPDSKLCQNFHWVPYPLGLMPYDSWHQLHHREDSEPSLPLRCPVCKRERRATAHMRKVFLVAERLTWEEGLVSVHDKDLNEKLNWKYNYELGILDPFVEDPEHVVGGKNSRNQKFYPYRNKHEMKLAFKLVFMTENLTETAWALWIGTHLDLGEMSYGQNEIEAAPVSSGPTLEEQKSSLLEKGNFTCLKTSQLEASNLTVSPDRASAAAKKSLGLRTPPCSFEKVSKGGSSTAKMTRADDCQDNISSMDPLVIRQTTKLPADLDQDRRIMSYKTLQDFYSLLDRIERTSYVGALFLEEYAEKLRADMCRACWFTRNVKIDVF